MTHESPLGVLRALVVASLGIATFAHTTVAAAATAEEAEDEERSARQHYAEGRYEQAIEVYGRLYADTLHPTYLRNIGRCYQAMGEPDRAISSFREYLRTAKALPQAKRDEVEGFIREMEELKQRRAEAARPKPPAPSGAAAAPAVAAVAASPVPAEPKLYERWPLWAGVAATTAVVAAAFLLSGTTSKEPYRGNANPDVFVIKR